MRNTAEAPIQAASKESDLSILRQQLGLMGISTKEFFAYLRNKYLKEHLKGEFKPFVEKAIETGVETLFRLELPAKKGKKLGRFARKHGFDWSNIDFHIRYRVKTVEDLFNAFNLDGSIRKVVKKGYNLSIMPLNMVVGNEYLLNKFIPKKDFFTEHFAKSWDPYGIFNKGAKIFRGKQYLASQKFERSVLMNITSACPIGCVGCYKGEFTRIVGKKFYTDLYRAVDKQSRALVAYLNKRKEIKCVIISGGEPLLLPNSSIKRLLQHFKLAKHLVELRICTGVIFQGLPFRIDKRLLDILEGFEKETGIKINFTAHLSHPCQFTPEALIAIKRITKRGFAINSQVPLQRNVNVFPEDMGKTLGTLLELARLQGASGVRPYKYILHMNVGSLEYSVPLEFALKALAELKYRVDHPLPETWQPVSCSILCRQGNVLLSPQLLFTINKKVCRYKDSVKYLIPVPTGGGWRTIEYVEPLLAGCNDDPDSLTKTKRRLETALKNNIASGSKNGWKFSC
jgi:L-lysine 2,3-aminomutase